MNARHIAECALSQEESLRAEWLGRSVIRVRIGAPKQMCPTALERYGFLRHEPPSPPAVETRTSEDSFVAEGDGLILECNLANSQLTIRRAGGEVLLEQTAVSRHSKGAVVQFHAAPDEDWIGFGDQTRERLLHRGHIADCHVRNVSSYIPVPFFMSTRHVGILVNTTHRVVFDMCKSDPEHFEWRDGSGAIDYYVMAGNSFKDLLDAYTWLTGRPKLPPEWSFGLWYICRTQANDYEVVNDASNFRR